MNSTEKQWVVVEDGRLVRTFGREAGAMDLARMEARERRQAWTGAKAVLITQNQIDELD